VNAILANAAAMRKSGHVHTAPITLRFVGGSPHAMASMHGRASCLIEVPLLVGPRRSGAAARTHADAEAVLARVQQAVDRVVPDARPHLGLVHALDPNEVGRRFPHARLWREACRTFDPAGVFLNDATRRLVDGASHAPLRAAG
jgi:hypothetical protein